MGAKTSLRRPSPSAKTAPKAIRPSNRGEALQRPQHMVGEVLNLYSESDQPGERRVSQDPAGLCYRASAPFHGAQVPPRSPRTADTWKTATTATDWPAPAAPPHSKSQVTFSRFRACCEVCDMASHETLQDLRSAIDSARAACKNHRKDSLLHLQVVQRKGPGPECERSSFTLSWISLASGN